MSEAQLRGLIGQWRKSAGEIRADARRSRDGLTSLRLYVVSDIMDSLASDLAEQVLPSPAAEQDAEREHRTVLHAAARSHFEQYHRAMTQEERARLEAAIKWLDAQCE